MTLLDFRLTESNPIPLDGLPAHVGDTPLLPLRRLSGGLNQRVKILALSLAISGLMNWYNHRVRLVER